MRGVGAGMSCGKDPASGVQDKSVCVRVCVCVSRRDLSSVFFGPDVFAGL